MNDQVDEQDAMMDRNERENEAFSFRFFVRCIATGCALFAATTAILIGIAPGWMWLVIIGTTATGSFMNRRKLKGEAPANDFFNAHLFLNIAFAAMAFFKNDPRSQFHVFGDTWIHVTAAVFTTCLFLLWFVPDMPTRRCGLLWVVRSAPVVVALHLSLMHPRQFGEYLSNECKANEFLGALGFVLVFYWLRLSYLELFWNMLAIEGVVIPFRIWAPVDVDVGNILVYNILVIVISMVGFVALSGHRGRAFNLEWIHAVVTNNAPWFVVSVACLATYSHLSSQTLRFALFLVGCGTIGILVRQNRAAELARLEDLPGQVQRGLYSSLPGTIAFDFSPNASVPWVTGATRDLLGYTHAEWKEMQPFETVLTQASKPHALQALAAIRTGQPAPMVELEAKHRDGHTLVFLRMDKASRLLDGNALVVLHDVTAEVRLRKAQASAASIGVIRVTTDMQSHLGVNGDVLGVTGYTAGEFLALDPMRDFLSPKADRAHVTAVYDSVIDPDQSPIQLDIPYTHKKGHTIWLRLHQTSRVLSRTLNGEPKVLAVFCDVTETVLARNKALASRKALVRRLQFVPAMVFEMVSGGTADAPRMVYVHPKSKEIYGLTPVEMMTSSHWMTMLHPEDTKLFEASLRASQTAMREWDLEFRVVVGDETKHLHGHAVPRKFGDFVRWTGVLQDATLERRLREMTRNRDLQKLKTKQSKEACAYLSHEIRNQLYPQSVILEGMKNEGSEFSDTIDTILQANKTVANILTRVLDLAKWEAGSFPADVSLFPIKRLFDSIAAYAQAKGATVEGLASVESTWYAKADEHLLNQAATNLVSNACKFSQDQPVSVRVAFEQACGDRGVLVVTVTDKGRGMTPEQLTKVMVPFAQIRNAGEARSGTGLGLPLTKAMVETGHKGTIRLTSEGLGKGTTATMRVPVIWLDQRETPRQESNALWWVKPHPGAIADILMVDDVTLNRKVTLSAAKKLELTFHEAANGEQAVDLLRKNTYSIVFMDRQMPGMNGDVATQQARANGYTLPIVMVSGSTFKMCEQNKLRRMGVTAILSKMSVPGTRHAMRKLKVMKDLEDIK